MIWIIIPAYNEERAIPHTLASIYAQPHNGPIIVVDGGSTDRTQTILSRHSRLTWFTATRGRASQMNAGAQFAAQHGATDNDWLLFLHADTQLPPRACVELARLAADPGCQAGGFLHRFSGEDWRLRMISRLDNLRCRRSRIIYGDQAMFVRQKLFTELKGFPDQPVLEDVAFGERLLTRTKPCILPFPVITDSRKFIQMGVGRSFLRVLLIIVHVEFGFPTLTPAFFQDIR